MDYSVGFTMTDQIQAAILALPEHAWTPAVRIDGNLRDSADVAELTGILGTHGLNTEANGWPPGCGSSSAANAHTPARS